MQTPDGQDHIVSIPAGHWSGMEFMILHNHRTLDELIDTAYQVYARNKSDFPEYPFSTYFGMAIQEAYTQFESKELGFTNDNPA